MEVLSIYNSRNSFVFIDIAGNDEIGKIYNSRNSFVFIDTAALDKSQVSTIVEIHSSL